MDRYVDIICKQNPRMTLVCGNKSCKHEFSVKTKDIFKQKKFSHVCERCGENTDYIADKLFDKAIKDLKAMGIK